LQHGIASEAILVWKRALGVLTSRGGATKPALGGAREWPSRNSRTLTATGLDSVRTSKDRVYPQETDAADSRSADRPDAAGIRSMFSSKRSMQRVELLGVDLSP
jgi:hypothetical protein